MKHRIISDIRFGLNHYLRTGNAILDMIVASTVPFLFAYINKFGYDRLMGFINYIHAICRPKYVTTEIISVVDRLGYGVNVQGVGYRDSYTVMIIRAVLMYLTDYKGMDGDTRLELIPMDGELKNRMSLSERLVSYQFCNLPVENKWSKVDDVEIRFLQEAVTTPTENLSRPTEVGFKTKMQIRGRSREIIDAFVAKVYKRYIDRVSDTEDRDARYLYTLEPGTHQADTRSHSTSSNSKNGIRARRYRMSLKKSFDTIFFPKKNELLSVVDAFMNKTGVYSIDGYAHKLGIMLYGEPGTGKTSVIKALAKYTNRHIVMVSLHQIKTNSQLIDLMFNPTFVLLNENLPAPVKLTQSDCIFVFEDIDACCDVVKSREEEETDESSTTSSQFEVLKAVLAAPPEHLATRNDDTLNLAGILNVLDGPLEADNRIVIFTSNHPKTLDSALVRPGRIDYKFYLTFACTGDICSMVELYFGKCEEKTRVAIEVLFSADKPPTITPANLEVMAVKSKDQHEFVRYIQKFTTGLNG